MIVGVADTHAALWYVFGDPHMPELWSLPSAVGPPPGAKAVLSEHCSFKRFADHIQKIANLFKYIHLAGWGFLSRGHGGQPHGD